MKAKVYPLKDMKKEVYVPASPFCLHIEIICASLAKGNSVIKNLVKSKDVDITIEWCKQIGATIKEVDGTLYIKGVNKKIQYKNSLFVCGDSSVTAMLMIPVICCDSKQPFGIKASKRVVEELASYSYLYDHYKVEYAVEEEVIRFEKKLFPIDVEVDGDIDIHISAGLLISLPLLKEDSNYRLRAPVRSEKTYSTILKILKSFGVDIKHPSSMRYEIPGNQRYYGKKVVTEQDTFALSHLLILAKKLKQKESLKLINCQRFSSMDDNRLLDMIKKNVVDYKDYFFKQRVKNKEQVYVKLEATVENSLPLLMVLGSLNTSDTIITKVDFYKQRVNEQYNIMKSIFKKLGIETKEYDSEIVVSPAVVKEKCQVDCKHNPYVALAIIFLALLSEAPIIIRNVDRIFYNYADAFNNIKDLGAEIEFIHD